MGGSNNQNPENGEKKYSKTEWLAQFNQDATPNEFETKYFTELSMAPTKVTETLAKMAEAVKQGLSTDVFTQLDEQATQISNNFGIAKGRMEEFRQVIADASPELIKLNIDQADAAANFAKIAKEMGGAVSLGTEAIVELSAAAKFSGQDAGTLAGKFREVGVSVYDAGDKMKDIANYARSAGVSVNAVASGVISNLSKVNTMNFQGGVEGLTRMVAESSRLGINMEKVLLQADKLMDPEKAIDMSAALQRLGVTSSALLDPLRAMDMAQNDPEALQKEMLNVSKEFTRFNEQTKQFEILPGSKRRLKEVAEAMGLNADELAKMSINAADFDKKMSQIKLPSFAEGDEETKKLIAGMAQLKGGVATVNVKDEKTGEVVLKQVDQLTPDDIEKLKNSQTEQAKSVEELAYDQLTQLQQINSGINGVKAAAAYGRATVEPFEKLFGVIGQSQSQISEDYAGRSETKDFRETINSAAVPIEEFIKATISGNAEQQNQSLKTLFQNLSDLEQTQITNQTNYLKETTDNIANIFKQAYGTSENKKTETEITVNHNFTIKGDESLKNFDGENFKKLALEAWNNQNYITTAKNALDGKGTP